MLKKQLSALGLSHDWEDDPLTLVKKLTDQLCVVALSLEETRKRAREQEAQHKTVQEERDLYMNAMEKFESQVREVQNSVQRLTTERDHLLMQLNQFKDHREQNNDTKFRQMVEEVDRERDRVLSELDASKTQVETLKQDLHKRDESVNSLRKENQSMREMLGKNQELLNEKNIEIVSMKQAHDRDRRDKNRIKMEAEELAKKLTQVLEDRDKIEEAQRETMNDNEELKHANATLSKELRDVTAKSIYWEGMSHNKEKERQDILHVYQGLGKEKNERDLTLGHYHQQIVQLQNQLSDRDREVADMITHIEDLEQQNHQYVVDLRNFERQSQDAARRNRDQMMEMKRATEASIEKDKRIEMHRQHILSLEGSLTDERRKNASLVKENQDVRQSLDRSDASREMMSLNLDNQRAKSRELEELLKRERSKLADITRDKSQSYEDKNHSTSTSIDHSISHSINQNGSRTPTSDATEGEVRNYKEDNEKMKLVIKKLNDERKKMKKWVISYEDELFRSDQRVAELTTKIKSMEIENGSSLSELSSNDEGRRSRRSNGLS